MAAVPCRMFPILSNIRWEKGENVDENIHAFLQQELGAAQTNIVVMNDGAFETTTNETRRWM